ncbi:MAG: hypothetical protein EAZ87_06310 [Nostocales cyanobacterium]|nr:MAG: hypothetical protein EAZ87_06310 [Nostocales cyanobacterium]
MTKVNLDLPPEVFSARRLSPDDFVRDMRLAAAIFWYQKNEISQEKYLQLFKVGI